MITGSLHKFPVRQPCWIAKVCQLFCLEKKTMLKYHDLHLSYQLKVTFSSPEPKSQVSFSDHNLSVVRRRCRYSRRRCRKLFTFSSSPERLGQFQPNLAQSSIG